MQIAEAATRLLENKLVPLQHRIAMLRSSLSALDGVSIAIEADEKQFFNRLFAFDGMSRGSD